MHLTNPWIEAGKREGRQQGDVELVLKQLGRRLGTPSASQEKAVRKLIEDFGEVLLDFESQADLARCWQAF